MMRRSRRELIEAAAAVSLTVLANAVPAHAQARGRIVVVGGGFGGATCARYLRSWAPSLDVTLIEPSENFVSCPFSNAVIAGLGGIDTVTHSLAGLRRAGIALVRDRATAIDAGARTVRLASGGGITYDRLVISPGIDVKWGIVEGYDEAAAEIMPHAWKAGAQTLLLRRRLEAMADGGVVVMTIPANPYRCPPGPYERASLIAHYLSRSKPRSKLILLDAKDTFSKQALFQEGWKRLYAGLLEWVPFAKGGNLLSVDAKTMTIRTEFGAHRADVANIIPPQRAARLLDTAGLTGGRDWCRVDPMTFESALVPNIHVLGDAAIAGDMPKSGFAASSQAKVCAAAIAALQSGSKPPAASFVNTCYSLLAPDYGISVADVYRVGESGTIAAVPSAGGTSPLGASAEFRRLEAEYARGWYSSITTDMFG
jgi:NADPH-dependent 2,4-dienoyl-CoA reductase/sulfur reductase-like enzyme